ncbi:MAG: IS701 family transposase [Chloroflexota bacterium]|nr:IS701 family transposase [Chloroflexota bacterium]
MVTSINSISRQPILIVEDNDEDYETILWSIKKFLTHPRIFRCEDGEEALDFLNQRGKYKQQKVAPRPSLVLLDLNLPGKDGRDVLEQIKKDPSLKMLPVVVFTGSAELLDVEQSYSSGANSFIRKPINLESFKKTIQLTLEYWLGPVENLAEHPNNAKMEAVLEELPPLQEIFGRISTHFSRTETRTQALAYLLSLLSETERKNCWQLATLAGDSNPAKMQRLLSHARWDVNRVLDDLREFIIEEVGHSEAIVALEEISFPKKGDRSVGVSPQYSSDTEQIKSCQLGLFLTYASSKGSTLLDRELYLPPNWANDPARRLEAEVPPEVTYSSKAELARQMLQRAITAHVPLKWITGNRIFGNDTAFQGWLEEEALSYVLEISPETLLQLDRQGLPPEAIASELTVKPALGIRSKNGSPKSESLTEGWMRVDLGSSKIVPSYHRWLIFRQSNSPTGTLRYWLTFGAETTPLSEIVRVITEYDIIKATCKATRKKVGLDHYEVRSWHGWYRHITLAMIAQVSLVCTQ